jgi:hypothetical protein
MYVMLISIADLDPVGSGPWWSADPDPDSWDCIRILALINDDPLKGQSHEKVCEIMT